MLRKASALSFFWATVLVGLVVLPGNRRSLQSRLRQLSWLPILLMLFLAGCGGGSSRGGGGGGGTPAGMYTITITASMGSTTQTTNLTLVVK
jgi:hypothetical protein